MADKIKMVRLRDINSGALVEVPEEKVVRLGAGWESADLPRSVAKKAAPAKAAPAKKAAPRKRAVKKASARQTAAVVAAATTGE